MTTRRVCLVSGPDACYNLGEPRTLRELKLTNDVGVVERDDCSLGIVGYNRAALATDHAMLLRIQDPGRAYFARRVNVVLSGEPSCWDTT